MKKLLVVRFSRLGPDGMALFPFILVRQSQPGPVLLNHERIHLRQQAELGILPFYVWYGLEYVVGRIRGKKHDQAYRSISFEREAFTNETDLNYLKKRRLWSFRRYLFSGQ